MPTTEFARMRRSDHSMLPPTPAATLAYNSPNACSLCHRDEEARWAEGWVHRWHKRDYQAPVLRRAALIETARRGDWTGLPAMLAYLTEAGRDEVTAASLIRLLRACNDERKWPSLVRCLEDPSPLVRARAAEALSGNFTGEAALALLRAARDPYRLVRVRAAAALDGLPPHWLDEQAREDVARAVVEFEAAMRARPDDPTSNYNLGNFQMDRGEIERAVASFETASKLRPDWIAPWVNASLAHNLMGQNHKAEQCLRTALTLEPGSAAVHLNLGLLLGELGRRVEAEQAFRRSIEADAASDVAAYNLCVLLADDRTEDALGWCRRAVDLRPEEPKYRYTLAFYLRQKGDVDQAILVLRDVIERGPVLIGPYALLGEIYEEQGRISEATAVYRRALTNEKIPEREKRGIRARLEALLSK